MLTAATEISLTNMRLNSFVYKHLLIGRLMQGAPLNG